MVLTSYRSTSPARVCPVSSRLPSAKSYDGVRAGWNDRCACSPTWAPFTLTVRVRSSSTMDPGNSSGSVTE